MALQVCHEDFVLDVECLDGSIARPRCRRLAYESNANETVAGSLQCYLKLGHVELLTVREAYHTVGMKMKA